MLNEAKQAATKKLKMLPSVLTHLHKWVWLLTRSVCLPYSKYFSLIVLLTSWLSLVWYFRADLQTTFLELGVLPVLKVSKLFHPDVLFFFLPLNEEMFCQK